MEASRWIEGYEVDPDTGERKRSYLELAARIGIEMGKLAIAATVAIGALVTGLVAAGIIATAPVALVAIGVFFVMVGIGFLLNLADNTFGVSESIAKACRWLEERNKTFYKGLPQYFKALYLGLLALNPLTALAIGAF